MFDIGFWEILLILVLALVVVGPQRLPAAARQVGLFIGKARRYVEGVKTEFESEIDVSEFKRLLHNQEVQINELQSQIKTSFNSVSSDVTSTDFLNKTENLNPDSDHHSKSSAETTEAGESNKKSSK